jgi:uncharacterized protein YeaO (DUF488 family)
MTLEVWTARISSKDPDRFDITRKSGGPVGTIFAPSWAILSPALAARREAEGLRKVGADPTRAMCDAADADQAAHHIEEEAWTAYVPAFMAEMRVSYRANRAAWGDLLSRRRVVLVCYCTDPGHCHRTVLASGILPRFGAKYRGEVPR